MGKTNRGRGRRLRWGRPPTPVETAGTADLVYVTDGEPGLGRRRAGRGFRYLSPAGRPIRDRTTLARIQALAIPPAWTEVWICRLPNGHLQATGRDARRRKQYRYHSRWSAVRDEAKYERLAQFGRTLPTIRARVATDLGRTGLPREKLLAVLVRLLETTFIRVGNDEYARANGSFGLTTLLDRHVTIDGSKLRFRFQGKSGKAHDIELTDRRLARLVKRCRDLPGQVLFQYVADDGSRQRITSSDVNGYLRTIAGIDCTAKDFRTWAGTLLAAHALDEAALPETKAAAKVAVVAAVKKVASQLGNTAAICRKCYVHPAVIAAFHDRAGHDLWGRERAKTSDDPALSRDEAALIRFLDRAGAPAGP